MTTPRDIALGLLTHYLTSIMRKAGMKVDADTHAELAELIDAIIEAARTPPPIVNAIGRTP